MTISFYGEGCLKIQTKEATILVDPFSAESGFPAPRFKFDVLLKTLSPTQFSQAEKSGEEAASQVIVGPGEYNVKKTDILGLFNKKESTDKFIKTIYIVEADSLKLCLLGHLAETPDADIMKDLEEIDVLFIPAGGKPFIEQKSAVKLIKAVNPKIAVPLFYKIPGLKRAAGNLKDFLDEINHEKAQIEEKLNVKKKDLAEIKKTKIVVLKT